MSSSPFQKRVQRENFPLKWSDSYPVKFQTHLRTVEMTHHPKHMLLKSHFPNASQRSSRNPHFPCPNSNLHLFRTSFTPYVGSLHNFFRWCQQLCIELLVLNCVVVNSSWQSVWILLYHLESKCRNSHVLVYHGPLLNYATFWEWLAIYFSLGVDLMLNPERVGS